MGLSPLVIRSLLRNRIEWRGQLVSMTPDEVLHLRSAGPEALREVQDRLDGTGANLCGEGIRPRG